ncbi:MAG: RagB/SusD family nutrient uptake outer membrane protein [Bacteroidales bacterium]|nr:RagB/SusD family nutrient uptake outer membrane protein [Bacteroidales bacterium]
MQTPHHLSVLNHTYENGQMCNWSETRMSVTMIKALNWINDPLTDTSFNLEAKRDKRFQQLMAVRYPVNKAPAGAYVDSRAEIRDQITVWPFKFFHGPGLFNTNVPVIRLAEILLTRSILRFNMGNFSGAADDLNTVRKRSWDESIGGVYQPITTNNITAEMIHLERMVEMFNEPDRIEYLRSLKVDIPAGDRENTSVEPYTSERFVWAVPVEESIYNENL